ncbi:MAG TPA: hypothetical protein VGR81_14350 [Candidatus Acidoferrales bacterium]|nr:hypothetical protein [Candidatus Acidoferrales bacterium]
MEKGHESMADKGAKIVKQEKSQFVTDEQIKTERKFPRRSFLVATGTLLAGAVALASGVRASAQQADPDKKKASDPDQTDKKKPMKAKSAKKGSDPDKKKGSDPDKKKASTKAKPKKAPPKSDPDGARL